MRAIVSVDEHWGIGKDGRLLHPIHADLRRFRECTMGHPVILGRKTLSTFPGGRPLPKRRNLILSHNPDLQVEGAQVFTNLSDLLSIAPKDSIVIGGASIYEQLLPFCEQVWITRIFRTFEADTFFPNLDAAPDWRSDAAGEILEEDGICFQYFVYSRKRYCHI